MPIEIRPLQTVADYRAAEQLQRDVWKLEDVRIVPDNVMITAQKNGGLTLGAFDIAPGQPESPLVGYLFGFVGLHGDDKLRHWSHQLGVLPAYRSLGIGYRLKLAQRDYVLAQGIDLIAWTFDPLESHNAYLNLCKLGAVCNTYLLNIYGVMRDALNQGLESDRFQVDWHLNSPHVAAHLAGTYHHPTLSELRAAGVPLLNAAPPDAPPGPPPSELPTDSRSLLVNIPAHFQEVKSDSMQQAHIWRQQTRALFQGAFAAGYTVVDLLIEEGQPCYVLSKDWSPM